MSASEPRPYHHGDLRRALIGAARQLLESEGPGALSLRAVAREAGVSPAAPYHHFKDKNGLLAAVADQGFEELADDVRKARDVSAGGAERLTAMGAAYAAFALHRRALYRVMSSAARIGDGLPAAATGQIEVARMMREAVLEARPPGVSDADAEIAGIAAWAAIHGLADLSTFKVLERAKAQFGGEQAFLHAVMRHLGVFAGR